MYSFFNKSQARRYFNRGFERSVCGLELFLKKKKKEADIYNYNRTEVSEWLLVKMKNVKNHVISYLLTGEMGCWFASLEWLKKAGPFWLDFYKILLEGDKSCSFEGKSHKETAFSPDTVLKDDKLPQKKDPTYLALGNTEMRVQPSSCAGSK